MNYIAPTRCPLTVLKRDRVSKWHLWIFHHPNRSTHPPGKNCSLRHLKCLCTPKRLYHQFDDRIKLHLPALCPNWIFPSMICCSNLLWCFECDGSNLLSIIQTQLLKQYSSRNIFTLHQPHFDPRHFSFKIRIFKKCRKCSQQSQDIWKALIHAIN